VIADVIPLNHTFLVALSCMSTQHAKSDDEIWRWFQPCLEDMFDDGMCIYAGYITEFVLPEFKSNLYTFAIEHEPADFTGSVWQNETEESVMTSQHSIEEYADFYLKKQLSLLICDYSTRVDDAEFKIRLIFEPTADLEIVIHRDNLLPRSETKRRLAASCNHLAQLRETFGGSALFLGPDTLDYPESPETAPKYWVRNVPEQSLA